uniref:Allene oxide synthase n=1 Tax=Kalanchoe fedtschenkoi TaxID=63787 RepID=A0A7N0V317_KALFE
MASRFSLTLHTTLHFPPGSSVSNQVGFQIPASRPGRRAKILPPRQFYVQASVTQPPSISVNKSNPQPQEPAPRLPIRSIPGHYGLPISGPIKDRQDYFYSEGGRDAFFSSKVQKYNSTVFRANMPPGPFISKDSRVIVLLDGKSFPVLFDNSKVEKKDLFTGTYMPSLELTGGYRMLSYLDPEEPNHANLKQLIFQLLKSSRDRVIPEFHTSFSQLFDQLETELAIKGKASFPEANDQASFNFLARALYGANPADTKLGLDGPKIIQKWVLFQLGPVLTLGLPKLVEELTIHSFRLPPKLIKSDYQRLYDFFYESSTPILDSAAENGISRDEACHNLLFATCFNSFGGMKIFFPNMLKWIGRAGMNLHTKLAAEVRSVIRSNDNQITMGAIERMPLLKSTAYECFRIEPPVPLQYGKARRDLIIESHDSAFEVKKGEILFGYQPFATKDPRIFQRAEEFVADRFVGDGEKLLEHVLWSNGPETVTPTVANKQCAGKDFVVLAARLLLVELFLRYDSFEIQARKSALGAAVTVTSLKRATF